MPWDPKQYNQFESERAAPFLDLMALIEKRAGMQVVDLGCGPGSLTARLQESLPDSEVLGVDSSPEMLAQARPGPGLRFQEGRLEEVEGTFDLVFTHAAIQWLDDHERLIPKLWSHVRPGGQLAVQMPSNHGHTTHQAVVATAGEEPFRTALAGYSRRFPVLPVRRYAELLYGCGATAQVTYEKVYPHVLKDAAAMIEWVRGTFMVPYLERLEKDLQEAFIARCIQRVERDFPGSPVFYGFNRILLWATRAPDAAPA